MIEKVISGGQTGADIAGLIAAMACGIKTGGTAPKRFRTEDGPKRVLGLVFGLIENQTPDYPSRNEKNVIEADATLYFIGQGGEDSAGFHCTQKFANKHYKPFLIIRQGDWDTGDPARTARRIELAGYKIINVAGNRESKSPGIEKWVSGYLKTMFEHMRKSNVKESSRVG